MEIEVKTTLKEDVAMFVRIFESQRDKSSGSTHAILSAIIESDMFKILKTKSNEQ